MTSPQRAGWSSKYAALPLVDCCERLRSWRGSAPAVSGPCYEPAQPERSWDSDGDAWRVNPGLAAPCRLRAPEETRGRGVACDEQATGPGRRRVHRGKTSMRTLANSGSFLLLALFSGLSFRVVTVLSPRGGGAARVRVFGVWAVGEPNKHGAE